MRYLTLGAVVASAVACVVAASAGSGLYAQLKASVGVDASLPAYTHAKNGDLLTVAAIVLALLVVVAVWRWLAPGRPGSRAQVVVSVLVAVAALVTLVLTWLTVADAVTSVWAHHVALKG